MKATNVFKKVLVSGLALAMIVGGSASAFAQNEGNKKNDNGKVSVSVKKEDKHQLKLEFKDVGKGYEWASKHIASLASKKVFQGYTDGTFQPNKPVTQVEAVATAIRLMGLNEEAESDEAKAASLSFENATQIEKNHAWAVGYLALALENELIADIDGKFQAQKPADRLWAAELLIKALGLNAEAQAAANTTLEFKDSEEIPASLRGYVAIAVELEIVTGYPNNTFRPNKPVTRAELAAFLDRTGEHMPEFNGSAIKGTVTAAVYSNELLIVKGDQEMKLTLAPDAFIYRDGAKINASELEVGDQVLVRTYDDIVVFVNVTKLAEAEEEEDSSFTIAGLFKSMTLNAQGKISTITITNATTNGGTQDSIYNVSTDVVINGDMSLLILSNPIELKGHHQLVTEIEIK